MIRFFIIWSFTVGYVRICYGTRKTSKTCGTSYFSLHGCRPTTSRWLWGDPFLRNFWRLELFRFAYFLRPIFNIFSNRYMSFGCLRRKFSIAIWASDFFIKRFWRRFCKGYPCPFSRNSSVRIFHLVLEFHRLFFPLWNFLILQLTSWFKIITLCHILPFFFRSTHCLMKEKRS